MRDKEGEDTSFFFLDRLDCSSYGKRDWGGKREKIKALMIKMNLIHGFYWSSDEKLAFLQYRHNSMRFMDVNPPI